MSEILDITYETLFSMFIMDNTPLLNIEELFEEVIPEDARGDINRGIGREIPGLKYFTLVSRAHLDRLNAEDLDVFNRLVEEQKEDDFKKAREIVGRTYKEVMRANPDEPDMATCLGPYPDPRFCFDNDAIVIAASDFSNVSKATAISKVIADMRERMFPEISEDLGVKLILFVED